MLFKFGYVQLEREVMDLQMYYVLYVFDKIICLLVYGQYLYLGSLLNLKMFNRKIWN